MTCVQQKVVSKEKRLHLFLGSCGEIIIHTFYHDDHNLQMKRSVVGDLF